MQQNEQFMLSLGLARLKRRQWCGTLQKMDGGAKLEENGRQRAVVQAYPCRQSDFSEEL